MIHTSRVANNIACRELSKWIDASGRTQRDVARELSISDNHLSMMLSGSRQPSLDLAVRIEALTGVKVAMWTLDQANEGAVA